MQNEVKLHLVGMEPTKDRVLRWIYSNVTKLLANLLPSLQCIIILPISMCNFISINRHNYSYYCDIVLYFRWAGRLGFPGGRTLLRGWDVLLQDDGIHPWLVPWSWS